MTLTRSYNVGGAISAFDEIAIGESAVSGKPADITRITIEQLLEQIRYIQQYFNKDTLYEIKERLEAHIHDYDNPHGLTAKDLGLDAITELYNYWVSMGNTGTVDKFLSILFQDLKTGTVDDLSNGNPHDVYVTLSVLNKFLDIHNKDEDAHGGIFQMHFPGTPKSDMPVAELIASEWWNATEFGWSVVGNPETKISLLDSHGRLNTTLVSNLGTSIINGNYLIPVMGKSVTNLFAPSYPKANPIMEGVSRVSTVSIYKNESSQAIRVIEQSSTGEHYYVSHSCAIVDETYTISLYIIPHTNNPIRITDSQNENRGIILEDGKVTTFGDTLGIVFDDSSRSQFDYLRVGYTFQGTVGNISLKVSSIDDQGNVSYPGQNGTNLFTIDALQLEEGMFATPHIFNSTTGPMTRNGYGLKTYLPMIAYKGSFGLKGVFPTKDDSVVMSMGPLKISSEVSLDWYNPFNDMPPTEENKNTLISTLIFDEESAAFGLGLSWSKSRIRLTRCMEDVVVGDFTTMDTIVQTQSVQEVILGGMMVDNVLTSGSNFYVSSAYFYSTESSLKELHCISGV